MKLTVVDGYYVPNHDFSKMKNIEKSRIGQSFLSFNAVLRTLEPNETVTIKSNSGDYKGYYKQVGVDKDGNGWIQRCWVTEY